MWIPEALYKRLPVVYAGSGFSTLMLATRSAGFAASGLALLSAAALTAYWRHGAKSERFAFQEPEADSVRDYVDTVLGDLPIPTRQAKPHRR